jgi:hypothetical protein
MVGLGVMTPAACELFLCLQNPNLGSSLRLSVVLAAAPSPRHSRGLPRRNSSRASTPSRSGTLPIPHLHVRPNLSSRSQSYPQDDASKDSSLSLSRVQRNLLPGSTSPAASPFYLGPPRSPPTRRLSTSSHLATNLTWSPLSSRKTHGSESTRESLPSSPTSSSFDYFSTPHRRSTDKGPSPPSRQPWIFQPSQSPPQTDFSSSSSPRSSPLSQRLRARRSPPSPLNLRITSPLPRAQHLSPSTTASTHSSPTTHASSDWKAERSRGLERGFAECQNGEDVWYDEVAIDSEEESELEAVLRGGVESRLKRGRWHGAE